MPRPKLKEEEKKERKRLLERIRKAKIYCDPVLREEHLRKDRERLDRRKAAGLIPTRSQMTADARRIAQKKNLISARAYYYRKKAKAKVAQLSSTKRKTWAELIGRPDLAKPYTKPRSHYVCCLHFEKSVIIHKPQLRPDAFPTKLLPFVPTTSSASTEPESKEISTQTKYSNILSAMTIKGADTKSELVQTSLTEQTQTSTALSSNTPRKRRLSKELKVSELKRRQLQNDLDKIKQEVQSKQPQSFERFTSQTEDEVAKRFCKLIQWQSNLKNKREGNSIREENTAYLKKTENTERTNKNIEEIQLPSKDPQLAAPSTELPARECSSSLSLSSVESSQSVIEAQDLLYITSKISADDKTENTNENVNVPSDLGIKEKEVLDQNLYEREPPKAANLDPCCSNIAGKALRRKIDVLGGRNEEEKKHKLRDSDESENEIKVFCPRCDTEVSHTPEGIQDDQIKILIAKVYHYFEQEYEELKTTYGDLDLTPLSKFSQRTALATGVSETTVLQILEDEKERNAKKREKKKRIRARKRPIQPESSSEEDCPEDNADANEPTSSFHEAQTLVVKVEPSEYYNEEPEIYAPAAVKVEVSDIEVHEEQAHSDPISLDLKTERSPQSDVLDNTIETLAPAEPAATKRKGRKIPRSDVTSTRQHTQGEPSTSAASSSLRLTEELDEGRLFGDIEMKVEEIEVHEEGVS